jgi:polysaccharide pyruvyl transferase CsaB
VTPAHHPERIGICGSYGGMNVGDEAILASIVGELRSRRPLSITILSRDPEHTVADHDIDRAVAVRELSRARLAEEIRDLDLLILGGGGILFDGEACEFVRPALIAEELGVPVATWAVGAGPLRCAPERRAVKRALDRARLVTVRDTASRLLLEEIGVTREIVVTADPAHLLEPEPPGDDLFRASGIDPSSPLVGVSVRGPGPAAPDLDLAAHELLAAAIDYLIDRFDATAVFIPMESDDLRHSHAIASRLAGAASARFVTGDYSAAEIRGLMEHLTFAVGMRLHFLLFAGAAGVPVVTLPYGTKVAALAESLGVPALAIADTTPGQLIAAIDRAWHQGPEIERQLRERSAELRRRAARTGDLVAAVLEHIDRPGESVAENGSIGAS